MPDQNTNNTLDPLGYPAGASFVPMKSDIPVPTPTPVQNVTQPAIPVPTPIMAPMPTPTFSPIQSAPAQQVGYVGDDEIQKAITPVQSIEDDYAEKKKLELENLIKRQDAGNLQEQPIVNDNFSSLAQEPTLPTPDIPTAMTTPTPIAVQEPKEEIPSAITPLQPEPLMSTTLTDETPKVDFLTKEPPEKEVPSSVLPPLQEKTVSELKPIEEKSVLTSPISGPSSMESIVEEKSSPSGSLEERMSALEKKVAEIEKTVSQWV